MAKNTYYVVFENGTDGATIENPVANNPKSQEEKAWGTLTNKIKGYATLNYAERVADKVISTTLSTIDLRTGHSQLQERMQFAYGIAKQGFDTVVNMAMAGSMFGAVGVGLGAVVGITDTLIDIAQKQQIINANRSVENTSIYLNRIRAGAGQDRTGRMK